MIQKLEQKDEDITRLTQQLTISNTNNVDNVSEHASIDRLTRSLSVERFGEPISLEPKEDNEELINKFHPTVDVTSIDAQLMKLRFDVTAKLSIMEKLMNSQGVTDKGLCFH